MSLVDEKQITFRRPRYWTALSVCAALVILMGILRLGVYRHLILPVGYGVPIVVVAWTRNRRFLWAMTAIFAAMTVAKFCFLLPSDKQAVFGVNSELDAAGCILVLVDLFGIATIVDFLIRNQDAAENSGLELIKRNEELLLRREEIARQNEELQSQTEELERQAEELRVANEDLASRQHALEALLDLSRSLTADLPRDQAFSRICQTMDRLLPPSVAAAILHRDGDRMHIVCEHGFGAGGPNVREIRTECSFASLIIEHGRTGYLEDISLRPDLVIPQPADGDPPLKSVLAAPLKMGGKAVGTLEVYARDRRSWTDHDAALVESLAAQASISMASAELFGQLEDEHSRLQTVLETVPFGVVIVDARSSRVSMNPAASKMLGLAREVDTASLGPTTIGKTYRNGAELPPRNYPITRALRFGEQSPPADVTLVLNSGQRLELISSAAPIRDRSGEIVAAVSSFVDVTALKALEQELDARRREAEESSVRKSRFLAAVSHDIRTPANAISLLAELIQRSAANVEMIPEIPELAHELYNSAMSLVGLVSDVLDLTRLDSGKVDLHESDFELNQMLAEDCRQLTPLAEQKGLEFDCRSAGDPIHLHVDRIKLSRVVTNLIGNAIKFTDKGRVRVTATLPADGQPSITVQDTGIGIAPEHQSRIFDEFFQMKNPERDRQKGTGLGLSISKRLIEIMGGTLQVQSAAGEGSTFTVTLPATSVVR